MLYNLHTYAIPPVRVSGGFRPGLCRSGDFGHQSVISDSDFGWCAVESDGDFGRCAVSSDAAVNSDGDFGRYAVCRPKSPTVAVS